MMKKMKMMRERGANIYSSLRVLIVVFSPSEASQKSIIVREKNPPNKRTAWLCMKQIQRSCRNGFCFH